MAECETAKRMLKIVEATDALLAETAAEGEQAKKIRRERELLKAQYLRLFGIHIESCPVCVKNVINCEGME